MRLRHFSALSALVGASAVVALSPIRASTVTHACRLRLAKPLGGEPRFSVPAGGRASARTLPGGILLCTLLRADGSTFANAQVDRLRNVLAIRFFRSSGRLLYAADGAYPAIAGNQGADVSCGSPAHNSIGDHFWRQTIRWRVGKTPSDLPRDQVVHALRAAQSEWANNLNWCRYPDRAEGWTLYEGRTSRRYGHDGQNTVDWGRLNGTQDCSHALGCTGTWYDADGNPIESDVRFNTASRWSVRRFADSYDIQSVAAHEFGHLRQFGHVAGAPRGQTVVMWPYVARGDTSGRKLGRGDSLADNKYY